MKKIILAIIILALAAFGWWTLSPLFINTEVQDDIPTPETSGMLRDSVYTIIDTKTHPASGNIRVIETEAGTTVRYENYNGTNGPDLFVYLAKDLDAKEFVSLGRTKGNRGNINYTVPADVDINEYKYVLTWCEAFGVLFDYAAINPG